MSEEDNKMLEAKSSKEFKGVKPFGNTDIKGSALKPHTQGRFPANLIHDGSDEVVGLFPDTKTNSTGKNSPADYKTKSVFGAGYKSGALPYDGDSGSASRFFYCAKSSRSERNKGLDSYLTVKYNITKRGGILCKEESMVAVQLLKRVISDSGLMSFSTGECGESITVQCHKDSLSTILTEINKIIELKILNSLLLSFTNESTAVVNSEMENGGNLAENAENLNEYLLTITKGNQELALGANRVALKMLSLINEKENWKEATNIHSTVKPISLMRYLCRLITPKGGTVLDCFTGSGSTGVACKLEGFNFIGIEKDSEYVKIAEARIKAWKKESTQGVLNI